uniref:Uncharacterized protein n=1 Tax=Hanusia phi TaxID=3032 RepID=Q075N7_9CRYP|nr:hypothetical protein [Hanusia phi]
MVLSSQPRHESFPCKVSPKLHPFSAEIRTVFGKRVCRALCLRDQEFPLIDEKTREKTLLHVAVFALFPLYTLRRQK